MLLHLQMLWEIRVAVVMDLCVDFWIVTPESGRMRPEKIWT